MVALGERFTEPLEDDLKWDYRFRFDWDASGNPLYKGWAKKGTGESEPTWWIVKFTYTGSNITAIDSVYGAWSDRASLVYS